MLYFIDDNNEYLFVVVLCVINCFSVKIATGLQNVLTCAKLLALVIIILGGFVMMGQGIGFC